MANPSPPWKTCFEIMTVKVWCKYVCSGVILSTRRTPAHFILTVIPWSRYSGVPVLSVRRHRTRAFDNFPGVIQWVWVESRATLSIHSVTICLRFTSTVAQGLLGS